MATQDDIEALFNLPPDPRSVAIALTPEQNARVYAVQNASWKEQEVVYQAIMREVAPELQRLQDIRRKEQR